MQSFRRLIVPYVLPYFGYVGIAAAADGFVGPEVLYGLRLAVVGALLLWARRWHCRLTGPGSANASVAWGIGAGIVGTGLWIILLAPFAPHVAAHGWSSLAIGLRIAAAGVLVPYFEELAMRGFVFRLVLTWDRERRAGKRVSLHTLLDAHSPDETAPGEWSWLAVGVSTIVFAAGHNMAEWPAAVAYGLLMCGLWVLRKDLLVCIAAHATTNIGLALFVIGTGSWEYW